jgi:hypothetical protein
MLPHLQGQVYFSKVGFGYINNTQDSWLLRLTGVVLVSSPVWDNDLIATHSSHLRDFSMLVPILRLEEDSVVSRCAKCAARAAKSGPCFLMTSPWVPFITTNRE